MLRYSLMICVTVLTMIATPAQAVPSNAVSATAAVRWCATSQLVLGLGPHMSMQTGERAIQFTQYYAAKHLTPITIYQNQETALDAKEQSVAEGTSP